jgi:hypothetical protein
MDLKSMDLKSMDLKSMDLKSMDLKSMDLKSMDLKSKLRGFLAPCALHCFSLAHSLTPCIFNTR